MVRRVLVVAGALALLAGAAGAVVAFEPADQTLPYGEVNFRRGFVRISAVGLPPVAGGSADQARQNAVSMAQKRLLGVVLEMNGRGGKKLREQVGKRADLKDRLRDLVSSADVKGKAFADGSVEVTLTVPTEGPAGLRALLREF